MDKPNEHIHGPIEPIHRPPLQLAADSPDRRIGGGGGCRRGSTHPRTDPSSPAPYLEVVEDAVRGEEGRGRHLDFTASTALVSSHPAAPLTATSTGPAPAPRRGAAALTDWICANDGSSRLPLGIYAAASTGPAPALRRGAAAGPPPSRTGSTAGKGAHRCRVSALPPRLDLHGAEERSRR